MKAAAPRRVLVSGASVAGPTVGYWLKHYGFDVTIVERAPTVRGGGYPIDVRGTAIDVVERMGLLPALQTSHIRTRLMTFVRPDGKTVGQIKPDDLMGGDEGRDVEVPRGRLSTLLYDATSERIPYRFEDSIASLENGDHSVDVSFRSGRRESFDIVIAADGLHSATRALVFGPEERFSKYLGYSFAGFSLANRHGMDREGIFYTKPNKAAMMYAVGDQPELTGLFVSKRPEPSRAELADPELLRRFFLDDFAAEGWRIPELRAGLEADDDYYADAMMQIHMPRWSSGRVAVVGDAAYGPSFFSGQGTSIALVGGYVLAGELALATSHDVAFAAYENRIRDFVEANQATASDGADTIVPSSAFKLWLRNRMIGLAPLLTRLGLISRKSRKVHSSLKLPDYDALLAQQVGAV